MKNSLLAVAVSISLLLLSNSCGPTVSPTPPLPPSQTPSSASPLVAPKTTSATAEDAAWEKIVEAAKKEGSVNVYTWGWTGDIGITVSKAFKDRYGITLNVITGLGAEFLERIKTEQRIGQVNADMYEGATTHTENMRLEKLLDVTPELPALRDKTVFSAPPLIFSPQGYYPMYTQYYMGAHVNTKLVKPGEEPKAWVDLLDPKWKGQIIIADPVVSISTSYFAVLVQQKLLGLDFLEKLGRQDLKVDPATPGVAIKLARGEGAIGFFATTETTRLAREGAPIKLVDTKEGVFANGLAVARVKGGPHPNATQVLQNWLLSQEGQDVHSKVKGLLSVRKDVPDYQHQAAQLKPQNPVFITPEYNDLVAKTFREKTYVSLLKPR